MKFEEAFAALREGKKIRRPSWTVPAFGLDDARDLDCEDMRADDWEVAAPPPPKPVERIEQFVSYYTGERGFSRLCGRRGHSVNLDIHAPEGFAFPMGQLYRLTLEAVESDAAHPAPPEPAKEADDSPPFSPEAAKDFAARGFERVNRPAPPAVAIGERSLGQVAFDAVSESDTRPWRDLQTYTREKWEEAAEAVRAAVLRELPEFRYVSATDAEVDAALKEPAHADE